MTSAQRRRWWAAAVLGAAAVVIGELGFFLNDFAPGEGLILDILVGSSSVVAGLVLWRRLPGNRTGPLLYLAGVLWALGGVWSFGLPLLVGVGEALSGSQDAVFAHLLLAYPGGRLTSRTARITVGLAYATIAVSVAQTLVYGPLACGCQVANGLLIEDWPALHDVLVVVGSALGVVITVMAIAILGRRWWHAGPLGRRTYAPVLGAALFLASAIFMLNATEWIIGTPPPWIFFTAVSARLLVPLAFMGGLLRSAFDRAAVGNLVIALDRDVSTSIQEVLAASLHDPSLLVAYWVPERNGYVDVTGVPVSILTENPQASTTLIGSEGERLAALVHDPALRNDPITIEAAVSATRMVIQRERLQAQVRAQLEEVTASRARIVEATEMERRRVERDLHDGAQQRLLTLALSLRLTREESGEQHIRSLIAEIEEEARAALADIRELAHGIHPAILNTEGLGPALEMLAERAPVPVDVTMDGERYPSALEATAYFAVSEALANMAKHSDATGATVRCGAADGRLIVEIEDDGRGGASLEKGSGLGGISDRVAAYDGTLTLTSETGGGTVVRIELPIR